MLSLPSPPAPSAAPPSGQRAPALAPLDAVLGALVSGALLPADVAGLPAPVAIVAALVGVRGGARVGVRLPVAVAALREAGFASEAEGLPAAAQGRVRRRTAIEAVEAMRASCAREVESGDEQGEDSEAGDGERGPGHGAEGMGGDPPGEAWMGAGGHAQDHFRTADPGVRAGNGDRSGGEDRGAVCGDRPPERALLTPDPEAWQAGAGELLEALDAVPALAPSRPLAPWLPEPDAALVALFSRLRAATTRPGASCDGRAGKGPRCGRCVRCAREAPQRSPAGVWLRTWRG